MVRKATIALQVLFAVSIAASVNAIINFNWWTGAIMVSLSLLLPLIDVLLNEIDILTREANEQ